jgi:CRISPR-associated endonuclease Cas2
MKTEKNLREKIEHFLYEDDSASATAAKFLLMTLALGGIVFAGAIVPGIVKAASAYPRSGRYKKSQYKSVVNNLKRRKLIEIISETDGRIRVSLTNKGMKRVKEFAFNRLKIPKPDKWDKKWRVVIFDIPTHQKRKNIARAALREKIKELGFRRLQHSAWVFPYPCEDEILLVAEIFEVTKYIEILTVDNLLHESKIKHHFNL